MKERKRQKKMERYRRHTEEKREKGRERRKEGESHRDGGGRQECVNVQGSGDTSRSQFSPSPAGIRLQRPGLHRRSGEPLSHLPLSYLDKIQYHIEFLFLLSVVFYLLK